MSKPWYPLSYFEQIYIDLQDRSVFFSDGIQIHLPKIT